jgi:hypothetical protein
LAFAVQTSLDASIYKVGTFVRKEHLQYSLLVKPAATAWSHTKGLSRGPGAPGFRFAQDFALLKIFWKKNVLTEAILTVIVNFSGWLTDYRRKEGQKLVMGGGRPFGCVPNARAQGKLRRSR